MLKIFKSEICLFCLLGFAALFNSCSKSQNTIDVSNIYAVDYFGNAISVFVQDGQWEKKTFTGREQSLFNVLDIADLSGTVKPDSVMSSNLLPNPFSSAAHLYLLFSAGYSGEMIFKYVIVDNHMNMIDRGATRIAGNPSFVNLTPVFPEG